MKNKPEPSVFFGADWGTNFWDKVIGAFEQFEYRDTLLPLHPLSTHSRLIFSDGDKGFMCYEAIPMKSRKVWQEELYDRKNTRIYKINVDVVDYMRIRQSAEDHLGDPYDFFGLSIVAKYDVEAGLANQLGNPTNDIVGKFYGNHHASMYCTEYAINALRRAIHLSVMATIPAYDIDPIKAEMWARGNAKYIPRGSYV